ncbi:hypothetical protein D3C84_1009810 [compost metagenome]
MFNGTPLILPLKFNISFLKNEALPASVRVVFSDRIKSYANVTSNPSFNRLPTFALILLKGYGG